MHWLSMPHILKSSGTGRACLVPETRAEFAYIRAKQYVNSEKYS